MGRRKVTSLTRFRIGLGKSYAFRIILAYSSVYHRPHSAASRRCQLSITCQSLLPTHHTLNQHFERNSPLTHLQAQPPPLPRSPPHLHAPHKRHRRPRPWPLRQLLRLLSRRHLPAPLQTLQPPQRPYFLALLLAPRHHTRPRHPIHHPRPVR